MREYATPATIDVPRTASLTADVLAHVERAPETVLFRRRTAADQEWHDITAARFRDEVVALAKGLLAAGVNTGDRVGLLSRTRYEWTLVDYACWWVGAATVPVYESSSADQVRAVLADCGAVACVVETALQRSWLRDESRPPALQHVWALDDHAIAQISLAGSTVADSALEARRATVTPDDLATVIYTSGTTGLPKGCCLTHGNFMAELGEATAALPELFDAPDSCTLLFLPMAHVFARIIQVGCVRSGTPLGHTSDIAGLTETLRQFRPTFLLAVPRVFEKFFNTASQHARVVGRGRVFDAAVTTAIAYSHALDDGRPGLLLRRGTGPTTGWCTRVCGARSAGAYGTRLRGAHRSVSGSATSSAASGCQCSRATGSPRRRPRSASTFPPSTRWARSAGHCPARPCGSPTTASCWCAADRSSPATGATARQPGRRPRQPLPTGGCTRATSARSMPRGSYG